MYEEVVPKKTSVKKGLPEAATWNKSAREPKSGTTCWNLFTSCNHNSPGQIIISFNVLLGTMSLKAVSLESLA